MTELRRRMVRDMTLRGFSPLTHEAYLGAVSRPAAHYRRSPDQLSADEVQAYLAHMLEVRGLSWSTCLSRPLRLPRRAHQRPSPGNRGRQGPYPLARLRARRQAQGPEAGRHLPPETIPAARPPQGLQTGAPLRAACAKTQGHQARLQPAVLRDARARSPMARPPPPARDRLRAGALPVLWRFPSAPRAPSPHSPSAQP
jgi:hypothetical protein